METLLLVGLGFGLTLTGTARLEAAAPDAPGNVQPAWINSFPGTYARITWDNVPGATTYTVQRYDDATANWQILTPGWITTFPIAFDYDAGGPERSYRVIASNPDGDSPPSAVVTTHHSVMVPTFWHSSPWIRDGNLTATSAVFSWVGSLVSGCDGMLEIGADPANMSVVYFEPQYLPWFEVAITNLQPETLYYYRITGVGPERAGTSFIRTFTTPEINDPPVTPDITGAALRDAYTVSIDLGITDPDNAMFPLTFNIVTPPTNGTISEVNMVSYNWPYQYFIDYTPNPGARGPDFFQYTAADGAIVSRVATVSFPDVFLNRLPTLTSTETNAFEDTPLAITLEAIDLDGDPVEFELIYVFGGTMSGTWPNFIFTPAPEFSGQAYFTCALNDPNSSNMGSHIDYRIQVAPVNDPPIADAQNLPAQEDFAIGITLTGWDREQDSGSLSYAVVSGPSHGTLSGTPPDLIYTPAPNYAGSDSFTFRLNDGEIDGAPAAVNIMVTPYNDRPSANDQSTSTAEDSPLALTLSGSDIESTSLTYLIDAGPNYGTLSGTPPNLVYTPAPNITGQDSFAFRVHDGVEFSALALVTIDVTPVNDAPVANAQTVTTAYNTPANFALTGSDAEGSALTYTVVSQPAGGILSGTAPNLTFTPTIGFSGTASFTFQVTDGLLNSAVGTVTITVAAPTGPPPAPTTLRATAASRSQINLTWTDTSALEDGFRIERSANGSTWTQIGTVGRNATTFASTGLSANKVYYYRVRAFNTLGNSPYSNTASARTLR